MAFPDIYTNCKEYSDCMNILMNHNWWDVPLQMGLAFIISLAVVGLVIYLEPTLLTDSQEVKNGT